MNQTIRICLFCLLALPLAHCSDSGVDSSESKAPGIVVTNAWAAATPPGASTAAAYLKMSNTGITDDSAIGASSDAADRVEFHTHVLRDGMMAMERLSAVAVPSGETITFEPHALHLMLIGLHEPLEAGGVLYLTIVLEQAGPVEVAAEVKDIRP